MPGCACTRASISSHVGTRARANFASLDLCAEPVRVGVGDVRRSVERVVVQADEDAVLRDGQIGFDEVGFLRDGCVLRRDGVLRGVPGGAPMCDELLRRVRAAKDDGRRDEPHTCEHHETQSKGGDHVRIMGGHG